MSTKRRPGMFDVMHKIGEDEPFFVLRAQDLEAPDLVETWATRASLKNCPPDKVREAKQVAAEMREWAETHGGKNPD